MPIDPAPMNGLVARVLRTPVFHWVLSPGLALITVTGVKTGRTYTFPVGYQTEGDRVVILVSEAHEKSWWRNYRQAGPAELRLRGRDRPGVARLAEPGSQEFVGAIERTFRRLPFLARQFGLSFDRRTGLSPEQVDHLAAEAAVVMVTLTR